MKAVVLEVQGKKAAVLLENGSIIKTENKNYASGQCVDLSQNVLQPIKLTFRAACAAAAVILCSVVAYSYMTPYSYVSIDVNPSIEYVLNRFDRVLSVTGVNDEGKDISDQITALNVRNRTISDAVALTVEELWQQEFFSEDEENVLLLAASSDSQKKVHDITNTIERDLAVNQAESKLVVKSLHVTPNQVSEAKQLGVTPGKLSIVNELAETENDPEMFVADEWLNKPVKDVLTAIDNNRGGKKTSIYDNNAKEKPSQTQNDGDTEKHNGPEQSKPKNPDSKNAEIPSSQQPGGVKDKEKGDNNAQIPDKSSNVPSPADENSNGPKDKKPKDNKDNKDNKDKNDNKPSERNPKDNNQNSSSPSSDDKAKDKHRGASHKAQELDDYLASLENTKKY